MKFKILYESHNDKGTYGFLTKSSFSEFKKVTKKLVALLDKYDKVIDELEAKADSEGTQELLEKDAYYNSLIKAYSNSYETILSLDNAFKNNYIKVDTFHPSDDVVVDLSIYKVEDLYNLLYDLQDTLSKSNNLDEGLNTNMKFLVENELEKRHKKHKKTIKSGAMGSFIHPDGGNQIAIDTFNNSVDMSNMPSTGLGEDLNEDYVEDKLKRLISVQHFISPKDDIQLFTTEKGNYLVKRNGKQMMILDKKNFRESEIEDLRLNGYFRDYDEARMNEALTEDTIKQNSKWVNKGKEGTHGKFDTKKEADAQRKAMFANGYRESLDNGFSNREDLQYEIKRYNQLAPRYDKLSIIDELMNNGYTYEEAEYIANNTTNLNEDWNIIDQIDAPETIGKLKPGDKFKNRNGVVITIIDPMKDGTIQFKIQSKNYPYEVRYGKEKSIQQMLYRNNYMRIED